MTTAQAASGAEPSLADAHAQPLLPERGRGDRPLLVIMATMALLAGLALLTAIWAARAGEIWTSGLDGTLTVQVLDPADAPRVLDALDGLDASALSRGDVDALLAPWLGNADLPDDIPVPALVSVEGADMGEVAARLEPLGIAFDIDDHQRWAAQVGGAAFWTQVGAVATLLLILGAGAATSAFATESAIRAEDTVIQVLEQVGAQDGFVARLFVERFFFAGLKAGLVGALGALALGVGLGLLFGAPLGVGRAELFWLMVLPLAFGAVAAGSAGGMAIDRLRAARALR